MTYVLALGNQKSSSTKTTDTIILARGLTEKGKKVLIIDMDPESNATRKLNVLNSGEKVNTIASLLEGLIGNPDKEIEWDDAKKCIYEAGTNLSVLPSSIDLSSLELELSLFGKKEDNNYLSRVVECIRKNADFDFILIDTPSSLGVLTVESIQAAKRGVIAVTSMDEDSINAVPGFIETVNKVKKSVDGHKGVIGVVISSYVRSKKTEKTVNELLNHTFSAPVFNTVISESDPKSSSEDIAEEVLEFIERM